MTLLFDIKFSKEINYFDIKTYYKMHNNDANTNVVIRNLKMLPELCNIRQQTGCKKVDYVWDIFFHLLKSFQEFTCDKR